jgi:hypothetical protein
VRWFTPAFFLVAAAWVAWHNAHDSGRTFLFPFVESLVPSTRGDPAAMGRVSVWILAGLGGVFLLRSVWWEVRARREGED